MVTRMVSRKRNWNINDVSTGSSKKSVLDRQYIPASPRLHIADIAWSGHSVSSVQMRCCRSLIVTDDVLLDVEQVRSVVRRPSWFHITAFSSPRRQHLIILHNSPHPTSHSSLYREVLQSVASVRLSVPLLSLYAVSYEPTEGAKTDERTDGQTLLTTIPSW